MDGRQRGSPRNGLPHLTRAAEEGEKGEGVPPTSRSRQRRAAGAQRGEPEHITSGPPRETGPRRRTGIPRPSSTQTARGQGGVWGQTACGPIQDEGGNPPIL